MATQTQPVICTAQQVYDYMQITAAQAAATLQNGVTVRSAYIANLMAWTATQIVEWIDYDYTQSQVQKPNVWGNDLGYLQFDYPIQTITSAVSWDPENPNTAVVDISAGTGIFTTDPTKLVRTDNDDFSSYLQYFFELVQALDPLVFNGWPASAIQVQIEMIATIYRESGNTDNISGPFTLYNHNLGQKAKWSATTPGIPFTKAEWDDLTARWKARLRSIKKHI